MGKKPEDQIEEKLRELEFAIKEEQEVSKLPAAANKSSGLSGQEGGSKSKSSHLLSKEENEAAAVKADLHLLGGFTSVLVGILVLFSNLRVTTGWAFPGLGFLGGGGSQGFLILLLIVGIGFFFYDYKNKVGWMLIIGSVAALIFGIFSSLHLYFASMSLLGFLIMFLPLAIGGALVAKGMGLHKKIEGKEGD